MFWLFADWMKMLMRKCFVMSSLNMLQLRCVCKFYYPFFVVKWRFSFLLLPVMFSESSLLSTAGSASCERQVYACLKGICICAFLFGMFIYDQ